MSDFNVGSIVRVRRHPHEQAVGKFFHLDGDRVWRDTQGEGLYYADSDLDMHHHMVDFVVQKHGTAPDPAPREQERRTIAHADVTLGMRLEFNADDNCLPLSRHPQRATGTVTKINSFSCAHLVLRDDNNDTWHVTFPSTPGKLGPSGEVFVLDDGSSKQNDRTNVAADVVAQRVKQDVAAIVESFDTFMRSATRAVEELRSTFEDRVERALRDLS